MYTSDYQASGWNLRSIYEGIQPDLLESEAFFIAFARERNLDGHKIMCVLTPVKNEKITVSYEHEGLSQSHSVLIVRNTDMIGMKVNDSLRIDGKLYEITSVSNPSGDIIRMELECTE